MRSISSIHDLFVPLPEEPVLEKDHADHIAEYADTAKGAWDLFRVADCTLSHAKKVPSLAKRLPQLEKVQDVASSAGLGLSIPKTISDANNLRRSISSFKAARDLPDRDPLKTRKVAQAAKKSFLDTAELAGTLSQVGTFINNVKIRDFNPLQLKVLDGINNGSTLITDGAELITECCKLKDYRQTRTSNDVERLQEHKRLSWILIAKNVASVAGSIIAIGAIAFGVALQSIPLVLGAVLVLNTVWLTMKLAGHFYKKIVIEAPLSVRG
jgi:hypothetical protein